MSYKQSVSGPGELTRAKQCKHQLEILEALYNDTAAEGKINISSALSTAKTAIDSLISAILD